MTRAVRLENVTLGYDRHPAVHHVSLELVRGSLTAVVGPNGSGKSTLLRGVMGLLAPMTGRVDLGGLARRDIAYLPQSSRIDTGFPIRVRDFVASGLWRETGAFGGIGAKGRARVAAALARVGMEGFGDRALGALSGGQTQRVLFARVIVQDAPLILLDEPFSAIDMRAIDDLLALVRTWHGEGRTVIAVLHDLEQVRAHFPECAVIGRELVAAGPTAEVLTTATLARARLLCEAPARAPAVCERDAA